MKTNQPTGIEYTSGIDDYRKFQFDRISPIVEVFHIFPDGSNSLNLIHKAKLKALFKNLNKIEKMDVSKRPLIHVDGKAYRFSKYYGLGTDIATDRDYITIYLEDLTGKSYEFLWFPNFNGGNE